MDVPFHYAKTDGYIDNVVTVVLDLGRWVKKAQNAAPLAVHSLFRPIDERDPLPRDDPVSRRKRRGEGTPSEEKLVLGWRINSRSFRVYLPVEKHRNWEASLLSILSGGRVDSKALESTVGRLNHAGNVLPQGKYFLNRMRRLQSRCDKYGPQILPQKVREDIELWRMLLDKVTTEGVDINNVTFSKPIEVCISDACEHGMGGFNMSGMAWRYELPKEMIGKFTINLLEFLAAVITKFITISGSEYPQKPLSLTDSSSALGWLYKASFPGSMPGHDIVAR